MAKGPIRPKINIGKKGQISLKGISGIPVQPTEQQIKIAEGLAKGLSKKDALMQAGISESNARSNSADLTQEPGVRKALGIALEKAKVGIDNIAQAIRAGYSATRPVVLKSKINDYPDYAERRQTARFHAELIDLFPQDEVELNNKGSLSVIIRRAGK